jgi:hypothetical protein
MVDSVKAYNIGGVSSTLELGKQGNKIVGSADKVSLKSNRDTFVSAEIADGTDASHAVTFAQLEGAQNEKVTVFVDTVTHSSGNVTLFTTAANSTVLSVSVDPASAWPGANGETNITVGDDADPDRLFTSFDTSVAVVDETNHTYVEPTAVKAYVSAGGAGGGTAKITVIIGGPDVVV